MRKENVVSANGGEFNGRLTRARAAALCASRQLPLKAPTQPDQKRILRANTKRTASDGNNTNAAENASHHCKKRAVLQDVTNVCCNNSYRMCINATKIQSKSSKKTRKAQATASKVAPDVAPQVLQTEAKLLKEGIQETEKIDPKLEVTCLVSVRGDHTFPLNRIKDESKHYHWFANQNSTMPLRSQSPPRNGLPSPLLLFTFKVTCIGNSYKLEIYPYRLTYTCVLCCGMVTAKKVSFSGTSTTSSEPDLKDIDSDKQDLQLCSLYAPEIYNNLRVAELVRRPCPNFMETIQQDITQSMRAILVDWLVEVSEEYKLVPDTLYLTVYLIDWFLSQNYIERPRLQLLGITCMLIASKYEEICAPRVEEFCFITDNTYVREEVLKMESQVLKYIGFQLFAPTAKTFLRRFLRAAQASYTTPSLELEYLANYLAELTLIDYGFLNFSPSMVAASAVFLSRWTLDQSCHPWNPTLEHYTTYSLSDLKTTVLLLQDLQLNTNGCSLSAIRVKYRQQRFKSVASFSSPKLLETLF
ncbi:CYCA2-4: Cyclin-A2-4 [Gossypium arboreum]|uniref:CYCA2-4: Cyclin-A2-4 n=1 Tax=Gossypium arboreum TaxID=29729 RepID=A0A0B0NKZ5_GOSAR|nr:CYCA2-4: Cyclin-A2-4 [Gossypium arboreum]